MAHGNTIFHQRLQLCPRHEFDKLAREHHVGQKFRSFNRWTQFGALFMGQLTGRRSLRDMVANIYLTNAFHLPAKTIAELYKERWQIELFLKWIKQHLKIKTFFGTSRNAVMPQLWIALCVYLLLSTLKFKAKIGWTMYQMLRVLQLTLFERRDLLDLFRKKPPHPQPKITSLPLFKYL